MTTTTKASNPDLDSVSKIMNNKIPSEAIPIRVLNIVFFVE